MERISDFAADVEYMMPTRAKTEQKQSVCTPEDASFVKTKQENSKTVIKKFVSGDFRGNFSTGATPKIDRPTLKIKASRPPLFDSGKLDDGQSYSLRIGGNQSELLEPEVATPKRRDNSNASLIRCENMRTPSPKRGESKFDISSFGMSHKKPTREFDSDDDLQDFIPHGRFSKESNSRLYDNYEVLNELGKGNYGVVHRVRDKLTGQIFAVKKMQSKHKGRLDLNEVHALSALTALYENRYLVRYFTAWAEDSILIILMENCEASVASLPYGLSEGRIRRILHDVCHGLKTLHKRQVVHLDIKPENILYSQKSNVYKIADLGLSRIAYRACGEDVDEGDSRYLAPELLDDNWENNVPDLTKADIFSLGMMAYELITRRPLPKSGDEWTAIRNGELPLLERVTGFSEGILEMVRTMIRKDPNQRPSAKYLLSHCLPSELELSLRWEKIRSKVLNERLTHLKNIHNTRIYRPKSL